ncbi:hypothetical protein I6A84_39745 [Frankia sp. CNm7]|uniref:Uncharacterized protein n=1 Tax=Frankia nepalensis TaxID=1836974 RepID=A0A937RIZ4_9ACTN|nr:DUF6350 family protein [Frankia nepalensis]MBL7499182.1 hypothetical protein [Frankia nepalensis]MBL7514760.1 hypothetical protein [Frankia nepalensis]MBL7524015.1 hypothetical protein [Frankia nepalensis]MBL7627233.1 hypothetical protein [Frankia nepalensis]
MAHPVVSRGAAAVRLARFARLARTFGAALPAPAVAGAAGLVAVQLLVLVAWGADTRARAGAGEALRVGADLWLLAHGTTLRLPDGEVDILPMGLAMLPVLVAASSGYRLTAARAGAPRPRRDVTDRAGLAGRFGSRLRPGLAGRGALAQATGAAASSTRPRARRLPPDRRRGSSQMGGARGSSRIGEAELGGRRSARGAATSGRRVVLYATAVMVAQTTLVGVVCLAAASPRAHPSIVSALLGAACLSGLGATIGVLAGARGPGAAWRMVPTVLRVPLSAGLAAVAALVAVGALGLTVLLIVRAGSVSAAAEGLDPGVVGGVGLLAVQLALLPNLVVWAVCYALGTGFAAGRAVTLTPTTAAPNSLPDLPVLRLLPTAPLPGWAWLVLAVAPLAAGTALALSVRRATPGAPLVGRLGLVVAGAATCAALVGLLAALSGGGVGTGAAAEVGPAPGWAMLATLLEVAMAGALVTSVVELVGRRD